MNRFISLLPLFLSILFPFLGSAQKFKVTKMEINPKDLTARVGEYSRVDLEGRKTALLKIYVPDDIVKAQGNVVGDVVKNGFEKWVYVSHDSKQVKLLFENHYPLMITFLDYDFPSVSEQMVYELTLEEEGGSAPSPSTAVASNPTPSTPTPTPTPAPSTVPTPVQTSAEILDEAKKYYKEKNYVKAMELFKKIDGDKEAQYYIGRMYDDGQGVPQDLQEAFRRYRKAAEQGSVEAQWCLAVKYEFGWGVSQDYLEAARWYRKAAEQGSSIAQYNLGQMYYYGAGVPKDEQEAVRWYRKAAEQGNKEAKERLRQLGY